MDAADPIARFRICFARALADEPFDASRAALATASADGSPSVRFVLVKEIDADGFVFYTNTHSQKRPRTRRKSACSAELSLGLHRPASARQRRRLGGERGARRSLFRESATRQPARRVGQRSEPADCVARCTARHAALGRSALPRPRRGSSAELDRLFVHPERIEFWHDQHDRMHDRILYERAGSGYRVSLLSP